MVDATDKDNYHIACRGGVLKNCLSRMDLLIEASHTPALYGLEECLKTDWKVLPKISIREALQNISPVGGQGVISCSCRGDVIEIIQLV